MRLHPDCPGDGRPPHHPAEDGCLACALAHPGVTVVAWRPYCQHGLMIGLKEIVEPGHGQ